MIERLRTTLHALGALTVEDLAAPGSEPLRRDCADALRLELDCRQLELGPSARAVLQHLSDQLEAGEGPALELRTAVTAAVAVLGLPARDRAP